jgi:hypothetical protein
VADSRRGADVSLHCPTSSLAKRDHLSPEAWRCMASIYDYVHLVSRSDVFACVYVPQIVVPVCMPYSKSCMCNDGSRLVEARCLVCRGRYTYSLPLMFGFVCVYLPSCPQGLVWVPLFLFLCVLLPPTGFLCGHGVWCDLPPGAAAAAFRRNAAPQERCSARACRRAY